MAHQFESITFIALPLATPRSGLPWVMGAIPHSPMHARVLATVVEFEARGRMRTVVVKALETRCTNFAAHLLSLATIMFMRVALAIIPKAVISGFLFYMGCTSLESNAFFERILLLFTQRENYPPSSVVRRAPAAVTHAYTAVQSACFAALWVVKSNAWRDAGESSGGFPVGLLLPTVLAVMIPFKHHVLPLFFSAPVLDAVAGPASQGADADMLFY